MNLLVAECKRFFARRFVRIMLLIVVALMGLILVGIGRHSQTLTAADYAQAKQRQQQIVTDMHQRLVDCQAANANGPAPANTPYDLHGGSCEDFFGNIQAPEVKYLLPDSWNFSEQSRNMIILFSGILVLFGFAVGASFVGAEWTSGNMANLLLWRPRRLNLLATKLGALLLCVFTASIVFGAAWIGLLLGLAKYRGTMGHVSSGMTQSLLLSGLRGLALVLAASAAGFAIAAIGRGTVTALGIAVGYAVVVEGAGHLILNSLHVARPERFVLSHYVVAWLEKSETIYGVTNCSSSTGMCTQGPNWYMRMHSAAEIFGIGIAALLVWAFIAFRRRDVS